MGEFALQFASGLTRGVGQGQQIAQQRAFEKEDLDLRKKRFDLEQKEFGLKAKMLEEQIKQQGGIQGFLQQLLGGGQLGGAGATPGIETPTMGQPVPPQPQPTGMGNPAGGLQLEGVSIGKEGPSLRLAPPNLQKTQTTLDVGGQPTVFQGTFDPRTGQHGQLSAVGRAPVGQRLEQLRAEARSLGFQEGTPEFENAVGQLGIVEKLPEGQRSLALDQLRSQASQTTVGPRSFTEQFKAASVLQADRITQETAAREQAKLEFGGLGQEEQKAIDAYTVGLSNARFILKNFTETELQAFVGLLQRPVQDAKLALGGMAAALGISAPVMESRFAEFKVANEKMRAQAFGAGGKQLTPFEASVVFGFTPTGREFTPAEYLAKMKFFIANAEAGREARLELARTSGGKVDPAKLEKMIQQKLEGIMGGQQVPQRVPQQSKPALKKPNGKLKFNPQTGAIE